MCLEIEAVSQKNGACDDRRLGNDWRVGEKQRNLHSYKTDVTNSSSFRIQCSPPFLPLRRLPPIPTLTPFLLPVQ